MFGSVSSQGDWAVCRNREICRVFPGMSHCISANASLQNIIEMFQKIKVLRFGNISVTHSYVKSILAKWIAESQKLVRMYVDNSRNFEF